MSIYISLLSQLFTKQSFHTLIDMFAVPFSGTFPLLDHINAMGISKDNQFFRLNFISLYLQPINLLKYNDIKEWFRA